MPLLCNNCNHAIRDHPIKVFNGFVCSDKCKTEYYKDWKEELRQEQQQARRDPQMWLGESFIFGKGKIQQDE